MGSRFVKTGLGNDAASAQYFDTPQQAFSQANQNLQDANYALPSFLAQQTDATITPGDPSNPESAPSIQGGNLAPSFLSQPVNLPKIQTPSFLQAQNSPQLAQKSETKMGKLFQILSGTLAGGAAGYGAPTVGQGFAAAQSADVQRKQQFATQQQQQIENQQRQQEEQRQQQMADQQGKLYNSEITKNAALTGESNARTSNKDQTDEQKIASKKAIAQSNGLKEGTPEYNQFVFGVTKSEAPEKKLGVAELLVYGDPSTPEYQRAKQVFAQEHRTPLGENDRAYNDRLKKDTSKFYADVVARQGGTDKALDFIYGRLKSGQLTDYQKQVAAEAVSKLRGEQMQVLR